MDMPSTTQRTLKSRLATSSLAALIGAASAWILIVTCYRLFFEYFILPIWGDAYIFPQWRYRLFDVVLVAWCVDGIAAAFLLFRSLVLRERLTVLARRTTVLFFVGFTVLVMGGFLGMWLRRHGV
jgi:hypothetical protein